MQALCVCHSANIINVKGRPKFRPTRGKTREHGVFKMPEELELVRVYEELRRVAECKACNGTGLEMNLAPCPVCSAPDRVRSGRELLTQ